MGRFRLPSPRNFLSLIAYYRDVNLEIYVIESIVVLDTVYSSLSTLCTLDKGIYKVYIIYI